MMNNKDLIEKVQAIIMFIEGNSPSKRRDKQIHSMLEKLWREQLLAPTTTTESKEADGEWIELAWKQYCTDEARDRPKRKEKFKQAILSNLPKTNDKRIDELIEKYKEFEDFMYNSIDELHSKIVKDLTSLKSPTTTDEVWECNLCPECGEHYRACGCAVQSQVDLEKPSESGECKHESDDNVYLSMPPPRREKKYSPQTIALEKEFDND